MPKLDELKFYLKNNKIQVLSLNVTWLNSTVDNNEVEIPGFVLFRRDRPTDSHGGVALYVRTDLQPVLVKIGNSLIILGSIYRPPNANVAYVYLKAIKCQFEKISNLNLNTILMVTFI